MKSIALLDNAIRLQQLFRHDQPLAVGRPGNVLVTARPHSKRLCRSTFGGNTTCVEVRCDDTLIVMDMWTGLRELGLGLMGETFKNNGLRGTILQSHVHWDHIAGYPFFPQLYMPRKRLDNQFTFYGGKEWDRSLESVLRGQMNPPVFPVFTTDPTTKITTFGSQTLKHFNFVFSIGQTF